MSASLAGELEVDGISREHIKPIKSRKSTPQPGALPLPPGIRLDDRGIISSFLPLANSETAPAHKGTRPMCDDGVVQIKLPLLVAFVLVPFPCCSCGIVDADIEGPI